MYTVMAAGHGSVDMYCIVQEADAAAIFMSNTVVSAGDNIIRLGYTVMSGCDYYYYYYVYFRKAF